LHCEVRLSVREATPDGRPDAGGDLRIDGVEIEAEVNEAGPGEMRERLANRPFEADPVDVAHRVHARIELVQPLPLPLVDRADADKRDALDLGKRPAVALELRAREAESCGEYHPVDVFGRARLPSIQVCGCVDTVNDTESDL